VTLARVLVTLAGIGAIGWVLWYFLAPAAPRAGGGAGR